MVYAAYNMLIDTYAAYDMPTLSQPDSVELCVYACIEIKKLGAK